MITSFRTFAIIAIAILWSCGKSSEVTESEIQSWEQWKLDRVAELRSPEGFLNLAGLYWLDSGANTLGSGFDNDLVFPKGTPDQLGVLHWERSQVRFVNHDKVLVDSVEYAEIIVLDSAGSRMMHWQDYFWYPITRAGDVGIRLKDMDHPALQAPVKITYFDYDPELVIKARFRPYEVPKELRIENVIGHEFMMDIPGQLEFTLEGKSYTLEPMTDVNDLFIIFSDETSAIETYGSGRYLHAPFADAEGIVTLDFNRSYNPPCAFTDYATCLLPPPENNLTTRIEAGERDYHLPSH